MIEICVLSVKEREGQKKAKGKILRDKLLICLDGMNWMIAMDQGYGPTGLRYAQKFSDLKRSLSNLGFDATDCAKKIKEGLSKLLGHNLTCGESLEAIDSEIHPQTRVKDSSGMLQMYVDISKRFPKEVEESSTET